MSDEVLYRIMIDARNFQSDIDFLWHGGEPLLAGVNHFAKAVDFQRWVMPYFGEVRNIVQSNLVLLNDDWCDFFSKNKFILSTSIDGNKEAHDANRVFSNQKGSHNHVLRAIDRWRKKGNKIGAVSLVTKSNVTTPKETYESLKQSGISSCNFHFCAQDETGTINTIPSEEETVRFFKEVFDLWFENDDPDFPIRNFRNVLRVMCGWRPLDCTSSLQGCFGFMAIATNGDVYPCHRYVGRPNYCIGNILQSPLIEIYERSEHLYEQMCTLDKKCQECEWLNACGNGCAFERLATNGVFESVAPECSIKRKIFDHIKKKLDTSFLQLKTIKTQSV